VLEVIRLGIGFGVIVIQTSGWANSGGFDAYFVMRIRFVFSENGNDVVFVIFDQILALNEWK
jgi:hypothetical protein